MDLMKVGVDFSMVHTIMEFIYECNIIWDSEVGAFFLYDVGCRRLNTIL